MSSPSAETELGELFMNVKEGRTIRLELAELGHPQPLTPIHCDNVTEVGIANGTIKKTTLLLNRNTIFYVFDQVKHKKYDVRWHPGQ